MKEYIERELLLIGVDGCISVLHTKAEGDPIQESAIKLVELTRNYIASVPTADVAEVRHGRWEEASDGDGIVCSECRTDFCTMIHDTEKFNYCPNCGALMVEAEHEQ